MSFNQFNLIAGLFGGPPVSAEVAASTSGVDKFEAVVGVVLVTSGQDQALAALLSLA
jgi:hypothetical protein